MQNGQTAKPISIPTALEDFTFQQQGPPRRAPAPPSIGQSPEPSISADSQQSRDLRYGSKGFLSDDPVSEYSTNRLSPSARPMSPQSSTTAQSVTRSNTFNTISSKQSTSTVGSNFSGDRSTAVNFGKHTIIPRPNQTNQNMSDLWAEPTEKSGLERSPSDIIRKNVSILNIVIAINVMLRLLLLLTWLPFLFRTLKSHCSHQMVSEVPRAKSCIVPQ